MVQRQSTQAKQIHKSNIQSALKNYYPKSETINQELIGGNPIFKFLCIAFWI